MKQTKGCSWPWPRRSESSPWCPDVGDGEQPANCPPSMWTPGTHILNLSLWSWHQSGHVMRYWALSAGRLLRRSCECNSHRAARGKKRPRAGGWTGSFLLSPLPPREGSHVTTCRGCCEKAWGKTWLAQVTPSLQTCDTGWGEAGLGSLRWKAPEDHRKGGAAAEDEMVGWHHWLNGYEFEQSPGDGKGQGNLVCYSPWGCKDRTEQLNNRSPSVSRIPYLEGHQGLVPEAYSPSSHLCLPGNRGQTPSWLPPPSEAVSGWVCLPISPRFRCWSLNP